MAAQSHAPRSQRGTALVEVAVLTPLLLTLAMATLETARAFIAYSSLVQQARIGARLLTAYPPGGGHDNARCLVALGISTPVPCSGTPVLPGLSTANVTITDATTSPSTHRAQRTGTDAGAGNVNLVTVTISGYQHRLTGMRFVASLYNNQPTIAFDPIAVTMRQQL